MTTKDKIFFGAAVVVVAIVAVFSVLHFFKGNGGAPMLGAAQGLLAENYIPYVSINTGYNSAYGITTTGALAAAATTLTGTLTGVAATLTGTLTAVAGTFSGLITDDAGILHSYTNSTTTTATSQTLKLSDVQGYDTVILTPNVGSDTVTLFASSTASTWLPAAGDSQRTCFINGTTTSAINLTFAGGTGTTLLVASSSATALGSLVIGPQKKGCFDFTRGNSTATTFDIIASFTSYL
jgi:hypothetical protein